MTIDLDLVLWRLWEGDKLVLEINGHPAKYFTTVEYTGNGWPVERRYRAFHIDVDNETVDAQLEQEGSRFFGQAGSEP